MTGKSIKLPKAIQAELARISGERVMVAAVLPVTFEQARALEHAGLRVEDRSIRTAEPSPPPRTCGAYARRNLDGWEEKRKDLPKEQREVSHWAPSWNSGSSHLVSSTVNVYPVDHHPVRLLTLSATILEQLVDAAVVRFRIDQPLLRTDADFARNLRFNLGLLRESTGEAHVYDADLTDDEYALIQQVDWEFLPRGSSDRVLSRLATDRQVSPERLHVADERLRVLDRFDHSGFIVGKGRFARYFGAKFGESLVALENLEYGNALYVFEEDWELLTQLSRTELIRRRDPEVHRIPHVPGWPSALRKIVRERL